MKAVGILLSVWNNGHEVVEILVGKSASRQLPSFFQKNVVAPVSRFESPNFLPSPATKRSNVLRSLFYNIFKIPAYLKSMSFINRRIRETNADVVINFYELLTGLTYALYPIHIPQICIGHQYLFLHKDFVLPEYLKIKIRVLNFFSTLTSIGASHKLALSFARMDKDKSNRITVVPPLLRKEVFSLNTTKGDYIHGYLVNSGFAENVESWHKLNPDTPLRFFWDRKGEKLVKVIDETLRFYQLDDKEFLRQMSGCKAYASTAGFESVCEAMYLGKPILMVPAHIEQDCNAFDAVRNGAGITSSDFDLGSLIAFSSDFSPNTEFKDWVDKASSMIMSAIEESLHYYYIEHTYPTVGKAL